MALFQLDQVFTYQDANDIKRLWPGTTAPSNPGDGEVWLDTSSSTPYKLKRYKSSTGTWETIVGMTNSELLEAIKTVDGSSSGLDADKLDGQEGSYYQNAGNLNAGTIPLARIPTTLTGKDADKLDGQEGSYYQNATNLTSGALSKDRLPAEAVRTDSDKTISAHTTWVDSKEVRIGTDSDFTMKFDGTNTYLKSVTHGASVYHQAENASGTSFDMLILDPSKPQVQSQGALISFTSTVTIADQTVHDTGISKYSLGFLFIRLDNPPATTNGAIYSVGGTMTSAGFYGVARHTGNNNYFGSGFGGTSSINVYAESSASNVKIQNTSGASVTLYLGFIGGYFA